MGRTVPDTDRAIRAARPFPLLTALPLAMSRPPLTSLPLLTSRRHIDLLRVCSAASSASSVA
ncbi:hypothetical protein [Streptomyces gilvosporeus]|nr:hypothetical protein [Streptomyces gilvosporeus]